MAIITDSFVSWGLWTKGGTTIDKMACGFVSWGLEVALPAIVGGANWLIRGFWWTMGDRS